MNYVQPNAYGLDYWVQLCQTRFYNNYVTKTLGCTNDNSACFGRIYKNPVLNDGGQVGGYIPEAYYNGNYIASNGQSVKGGLFFNQGMYVSFFGELENKKTDKGYIAKMEFIVFADMALITPGGLPFIAGVQRLDEVLLSDLESWMTFNGCGFQVKQTTSDIDKVLERYSGVQKKNTLIKNMSATATPSFCALKLILELAYDPGQTRSFIIT